MLGGDLNLGTESHVWSGYDTAYLRVKKRVVLHRDQADGEFQEIVVKLKDGTEQRYRWDAKKNQLELAP
jgi:hypothetical protein